jgi:hypothetical protein
MTMGLEPMNPLDWIEIDECYEKELALRKDLIKNNRNIVIHSLPGVRHWLLSELRNAPRSRHAVISAFEPKEGGNGWLVSLAPLLMQQGARAYNA